MDKRGGNEKRYEKSFLGWDCRCHIPAFKIGNQESIKIMKRPIDSIYGNLAESGTMGTSGETDAVTESVKLEDSGVKEEPTDNVKAQGQDSLLSCPFCGSEADAREMQSFERGVVTQFCIGCQAYGPTALTIETARERWNKRAARSVSALTKSDDASVIPKPMPSVSSEAASVKPEKWTYRRGKLAQLDGPDLDGWCILGLDPGIPSLWVALESTARVLCLCHNATLQPSDGWISFDPTSGGRKPTREDANICGLVIVRDEYGVTWHQRWDYPQHGKAEYEERRTHFKPLCFKGKEEQSK